jgi:hypothetical protein
LENELDYSAIKALSANEHGLGLTPVHLPQPTHQVVISQNQVGQRSKSVLIPSTLTADPASRPRLVLGQGLATTSHK